MPKTPLHYLHRGVTDSPIGKLVIHANKKAVVSLQRLVDEPRFSFSLEKGTTQEHAKAKELFLKTKEKLGRYFAGNVSALNAIPIEVQGTEFQKRVWSGLRAIRVGSTKSYSALAKLAKSPNASRAAGSACAKNQLLLLVPCHRALGVGSTVGKFSAGTENKRFLLEHEGALR